MIKPKKNVFFRISVNFGFWMYLIWTLIIVSYSSEKFHIFQSIHFNDQDVSKILEIADWKLWVLQILAGLILLLIFNFLKLFEPDQFYFFKSCGKDDFYSVFLNFGSIFLICGVYKMAHGKYDGFLTFFLGLINIIFYAYFSPFKSDDFEQKEEVHRTKSEVNLNVNPIFIVATFIFGLAIGSRIRRANRTNV